MSIPEPPPLPDKVGRPKCKVVIASGKVEEGYCITQNDLIPTGSFFQLPGTQFLVDTMSRNLFRDPKINAFVLVPKTLGSSAVIVEGKQIYTLHPLKKQDYDRYERKELSSEEIEIKYDEPKISASGTYGEVEFHPTSRIAVKKAKSQLEHGEISEDMIREIAIYRLLREISCLPKLFAFNLKDKIELEFELGTGTLLEAIARDGARKGIPVEKLPILMFRLAKCLRTSASQGIIHCDLKPGNIILSREGHIQIIDWGIAEIDQSLGQNRKKGVSKQTFWYRAPEILLFSHQYHLGVGKPQRQYSNKIDIFSLGLIFLEMFSNGLHGENEEQQVYGLLRKVLGIPRAEITNTWKVLEMEVQGGSKSEIIKREITGEYFWKAETKEPVPEVLADLISKMLEFNPSHRIDYDEIVLHPLFQGIFRESIPKLPVFINNMPIIPDIHPSWKRGELEPRMRGIVFEWIQDVCVQLNMSIDTMCLAFQILDLIAVKKQISKKKLQAHACTAMLLASKLYDVAVIDIGAVVHYSENSTTPQEQIDFLGEFMILLDGNILIPSLFSYASHYGYPRSGYAKQFKDVYLRPDIYAVPFAQSWKRLLD